MRRNINKEFIVNNAKKAVDYCYQNSEPQNSSTKDYDENNENSDTPIVGVDPEKPVDDIENDEEIMALMDYIAQMNASDIDPDKD